MWPSAFMVLISLAVTGAVLAAYIEPQAEDLTSYGFVERFPEMWRLLEYPKIVLVVHKTRDVLIARGRKFLDALYV